MFKKMKQQRYIYFQVTKLEKYQKIQRNWFIIFLIIIPFIIYSSFFPTFIFFVILVWSMLFLAVLILAHTQDRIYLINKSKKRLKNQLENNNNEDLILLAGELGYPYSDLKMAVKYLNKKKEISKEFY
jgi:fatty acid desaturase